jgi:FkbM family methyltransferase
MSSTTRRRKHKALYYVRSISVQVWSHPANQDHRLRALLRAFAWQVRKRVSSGPFTYTLPGGALIRCHDDNTVASQLWYFGAYTEFDELHFMTRYLRAGDCVIDAGANIGLYTFMAAPIVGPTGRVDAFEPGPEAAARFTENESLNDLPQITFHQVALADHSGEAHFSTGWDVSNRMTGTETPTSITVPVTTLDEVLAERNYAYAKLDVEGAEHLALVGAQRLLREQKPPVWQVEVFGSMLQSMGSSVRDIETIFKEHDYVFASYDACTNSLVEVATLASDGKNRLAIARSHWAVVEDRLQEAAS